MHKGIKMATMGVFLMILGCSVSHSMDKDILEVHMEPYFNAVVESIYWAEGGPRAKKPYGILSVSCNDRADCRRICYNTVRNNYFRWIKAGRKGEYLRFLAGRYAPIGSSNDPNNLNQHWYGNVKRGVLKRGFAL